ncbi:glycosyltransferase family 2 protein [Flavobacterium suncheonense]|uniref:Glycosyl transferase n=1 Tax=Flavobacterium suncheonense GH29-5 = DSM 17707 TaxID=1121899 RepID=A0A0A2MEU4_9FLAO|nr:glycosyltransferase family 2 protein [Flavobacterium suncheonense]KGO90121.1 glycosyl transferase [Flavobacterium suncheonense GH29-5 = DSM 17707]
MNSSSENKISGLVITLNEEKNIQPLIDNLSFADEIIIVDSFSSDKTAEIAKSNPSVKFIENKFENYSAQRNFAMSLASYPWILFLDADERIPDNLKEEIIATVKKPDSKDAYFFYRKFMFKNSPLLFSGWQTDKNIRLFKKDKANYVPDRLVHEKLEVRGSVGKLKNQLIHYSYTDYESYKAKMTSYGKLKAQELFSKNMKPNFFHYYIKPAYKFFHSYVIRLGILDGKKGLTISYLNAYSIFVRFKELDKLYRK